jgi:hypothetical protein
MQSEGRVPETTGGRRDPPDARGVSARRIASHDPGFEEPADLGRLPLQALTPHHSATERLMYAASA